MRNTLRVSRRAFVSGAAALAATCLEPRTIKAQGPPVGPITAIVDPQGIVHVLYYSGSIVAHAALASGTWNVSLPALSLPDSFSLFSLCSAAASNNTLQAIGTLTSPSQPPVSFVEANGTWSSLDGSNPSFPQNATIPITPENFFLGVAAALGAAQVLEVVFLSSYDNFVNLVHYNVGIWWPYNGASSSELKSSGTKFSAIALAAGNPVLEWQGTQVGSLQLVGIGLNDGKPYLMWQDPLVFVADPGHPTYQPTGQWSWYGQILPNETSNKTFYALAMGRSSSGVLQLILIGNDGQPYLMWQDTMGNWHWYGSLPNPGGVEFDKDTNSLIVVPGNNGTLQVLFIGTDLLPHLIYQDATGKWFPYSNPSQPGSNILNTNGTQLGRLVAVTTSNPQNVNVFGLATSAVGPPYWIFQDQNGNWSWLGQIPS